VNSHNDLSLVLRLTPSDLNHEGKFSFIIIMALQPFVGPWQVFSVS
jgi:hypothetical protein